MINIPNEPLLFDLFYGGKAPGEEADDDVPSKKADNTIPAVTEETPTFKNIHISNVYCIGSGRAMFFNGLPEMRIQNVNIKDVVITDASEGAVLSQADGVTMENVKITPKNGPEVKMKNVKNISINGMVLPEIGNSEKEFSLK